MGLFGDDSDDDEDEKSFREEVENIREEQENDQQDSSSTEDSAGDPSRLAEELEGATEATVSDDVQQWEYFTYRLDSSEHLDIVEAGFGERLTSGSSEYPLPPDEVLNQLGKQGWELVETVEKSGREFGELASNEGSMTYAYIFRRPVSYSSESDDDSEEAEVE